MRRLAIIAMASMALGASCAVPTPPGAPGVVVSPTPGQTISAFGASGAWWPNDLVHFPPPVQRAVARLLFTRRGIALSGYRYNIGGGGVGVTTPARAPHLFHTDVAGRTFLRAASDAHVPVLTGFVNSAPPRFTTNGQSCGGDLRPGTESDYAAYLTHVVRALRRDDHVTLSYVSPMNEPDNSFGDCGQEGMSVPIAQRGAVVRALGRELAQRAPHTHVIADETTADAILATEAPQWLAEPGTTRYLAAIAHHTYDFPNDTLRALVPPIAKQFDRPTWMTEICCYKGSGGVATSFGPNYDPTITQGLWLADQVYDDFTVAGDSAWYWWTALSSAIGCDPHADPSCVTRVNPSGWNDGLLYYDANHATDGVNRIFTTKRFYTLGQFSRYVRPGSVLHAVTGAPDGTRVMAFARNGRWTIVAWNEATTAKSFALTLPGGRWTVRSAVATSASAALSPAARPRCAADGRWHVTLPASSIVTYSFVPQRHR